MLKLLLRLLSRIVPISAFGRNTVKLLSGTAIAQIIAFLASPLLTRVYEPSAYGTFAALVGVANTLTVISSFSYETAIPVPRRQIVATNTIFLSLILLGANLILITIIIIAFAPPISRWLFDDGTSPAWLILIPLLVAGLGFNQIANSAALRAQVFNSISSVKIIQSTTTAVSQASLFFSGAVGLLLGMLAGQIVGAKYLWRVALPQARTSHVRWRNIVRAMIRFRRFPLYEGPFTLMNSAGNFMPPVLLVAFFGPTIGGVFALAQRVLSAPVGLFATASGQVFFASASKANREGTLGELVMRVHRNLSQLMLPALLLIALTGPSVFAIVFGERWRDAGLVATVMTPWLYMQALGSAVSTVWIVQGNLHHGTIIGAVGFLLRCAAIFSAVWIKEWILVIILFSTVNTIYYLIVALYAVRFSGTSFSSFARTQLKAVGVACAFALPTAAGVCMGAAFEILIGLTVSILFLTPHYLRTVRNM